MSQGIDLKLEYLDIVRYILNQYIPQKKVIVFGSRATWTTHSKSDLDLCIMGDEKLPAKDLAALEHAFDESPLPMKVDIVEWSQLDDAFKQIIQQDGILLDG